MKAKDLVRKVLGQPTSAQRREAEKEAARKQKRAERSDQKRRTRDQELREREMVAARFERAVRQVEADYEADRQSTTFDARLPSPALNYNQKPCTSYTEYKDIFAREAVMRQLPALLDLAHYQEDAADFSMLDYGCGLGRLAFAFSSYFIAKVPGRRYFGYEVHPEALAFLRNAYAPYSNVTMFGEPISVADSYVEIHEGQSASTAKEEARIDAVEVELSSRITEKLDLQFSSSVFTHMYRPAIVHVLKQVGSLMKPTGVCVNTWLVVDQLADTAIRCGLADRRLPYENKEEGFLYYQEQNPLMCTAYRLEAIKAIYEEAGHEILDILWGHWSGREPTHHFSRQDAVISRPKR